MVSLPDYYKNKTLPDELCRRAFENWKVYTEMNKSNREESSTNNSSQKLEIFLKTLRERRTKIRKERRCKSTPIQQKSSEKADLQLAKKTKSAPNCYEHRLKAQRYIILQQKHTIFQQKQIINELQLGELDETINRSIEETEKDLQEALLNCSVKLKYKKRLLLHENREEDLQLQLRSSKAPKIVQEMERRAFERELKRQAIMERKKLLSQLKKEAAEMEIARKKALSEEERKRNIKEMKERRRKELQEEQKKQLRRQQFLDNCSKADGFYRKRLKKLGFGVFLKLMAVKEHNEVRSIILYERSLEKKAFKRWIEFVLNVNQHKVEKADGLYSKKLVHYCFKQWVNVYNVSIKHLQVAQDLYDLMLQSKTFIHWHRYTCVQYVLQLKNMQKAQRHYNSRIVLQYFYQWKSLPAVIQLEKAKEEKKRRWREKVWEVLADFEPPVEV